jgi:hypothetical protein
MGVNIDEEKEFRASYIVAIEWNGRKPSTTFYNRLHDYGLWSRDRRSESEKKETSLMAWRSSRPGGKKSDTMSGMVIQEGMIMVSSYSLAQEIALLASKDGALFVQIGQMFTSDVHASAHDLEAFEARQLNISKRGPKPVSSGGTYCVTCYEEAVTYEVDMDSAPSACLHHGCRSPFIVATMGRPLRFRMPQEGEALSEYWARSRFSTGEFSIPVLADLDNGACYPAPKLLTKQVKLPKLKLTKSLKDAMEDDVMLTFRVYDVAYCLSVRSMEARKAIRVHAVNAFAAARMDGYYSFALDGNSVDTLDLASIDYETFSKYL